MCSRYFGLLLFERFHKETTAGRSGQVNDSETGDLNTEAEAADR